MWIGCQAAERLNKGWRAAGGDTATKAGGIGNIAHQLRDGALAEQAVQDGLVVSA